MCFIPEYIIKKPGKLIFIVSILLWESADQIFWEWFHHTGLGGIAVIQLGAFCSISRPLRGCSTSTPGPRLIARATS